MSKFKSQKGFTLAELLVVVAIIAVLVAVAIPVFSASQKKAKLAADDAMIREAYALMQYAKITEEITVDGETRTLSSLFTETQKYYYLSKDGSLTWNCSDAYKFQTSEDSCEYIPQGLVLGSVYSSGHSKDSAIYILLYGEPSNLQLILLSA